MKLGLEIWQNNVDLVLEVLPNCGFGAWIVARAKLPDGTRDSIWIHLGAFLRLIEGSLRSPSDACAWAIT